MGLPDGKTAIITGGTSGIGLATAARYLDEGAHVFITGRRQSELDAALAQLNTLHVLKQSSPVAADGQGAGM